MTGRYEMIFMYVYIHIYISIYMCICIYVCRNSYLLWSYIYVCVIYVCALVYLGGADLCIWRPEVDQISSFHFLYSVFKTKSLVDLRAPHFGYIWRPSNSAFLTNSTPHAQTQASGLQVHATTPVFYINVSSGNLNPGRFLLQQPLHSSISPDPNRVFF